MKQLVTERTILRSFFLWDLHDFYSYAKSPVVGPMAGWKPHESVQESEAVLREMIAKENVWAIEEKESGRVIGSVGLHPDTKRGMNDKCVQMLGYGLEPSYWGRGLMTEVCREVLRYAFEELELELVSAFHYPGNRRSQRVIEKLGFYYEGVLRSASVLPDGDVTGNVCYSMTREEYHRKRWRDDGLTEENTSASIQESDRAFAAC